MKSIFRRLRRLENARFGSQHQHDEDGRIVDVMRERLCRYLAQERGVPYEEVLRQSVIESQARMEGYAGDGTIADTMRYALRRRFEASVELLRRTIDDAFTDFDLVALPTRRRVPRKIDAAAKRERWKSQRE